jgi:hypothetical protein
VPVATGEHRRVGVLLVKRLAGRSALEGVASGIVVLALQWFTHHCAKLALQKGKAVVEVWLLAQKAKGRLLSIGSVRLRLNSKGSSR